VAQVPCGWGIVLWLVGVPAVPPATALTFSNVTVSVGITHLHTMPDESVAGRESAWMSGGAVAEDFDGDGWIDLYVLQGDGSPNLLYRNIGGTFTNEAAARGADIADECMGAAAADFDGDDDVDICVTRLGNPPLLLINNGGGNFSVESSMLSEPQYRCMSPSWGDIDNDGLLELAVGQWVFMDQGLFLYHNVDGVLQLHPFRSTPVADPRVFSPRFADFNNDGLSDLSVVADFLQSQLYVNRDFGLFDRVTAAAGVGTDENGMGTTVGDIDNDGDLDLFVSSIRDLSGLPDFNWGITGNRLYENDGNGVFTDATTSAGVRDGNWGWGSAFGDLDNDGDLDLFHVNGWPEAGFPSIPLKFNNQPARLFENQGSGTFQEVAGAAGADDIGQGRCAILFDADNDGDLDIFIGNNQELVVNGMQVTRNPGPPVLLRNDTPPTNHWLKISLSGTNRVHRHGIGSRVYVTTSAGTQMRELNASTGFLGHGPERIAHFGLGAESAAGMVEVRWSTEDRTVLNQVAGDGNISIPSPAAVVSTRIAEPGESVTFSAANVLPLGTPREWIADGPVLPDPLVTSFTNEGPREVQLNLYDPGGTTLLRSEFYRITVRSGLALSIHAGAGLGPASTLHWDAIAGETYRVQSCSDLTAGVWSTFGEPLVAAASGPREVALPTHEPALNFRVVDDSGP
jgi:hypothetical protein